MDEGWMDVSPNYSNPSVPFSLLTSREGVQTVKDHLDVYSATNQ